MPRPTLADQMYTAFAVIERAAIEGRRCPENLTHGVTSPAVTALARAGRIRIEIYFHNWRVVTILEGEHRGKTTAACPKKGAMPYRTIAKGVAELSYTKRRASKAPVTLPSTTTGKDWLNKLRGRP